MTDKQEADPLPPDFPRDDLPIVFADGVISAAWEAGVLKFYMFRLDPHTAGHGGNRTVIIQQVVMPAGGLVNALGFLDRCARKMISQGQLTQAQYDAAFKGDG